MTEKSLFLDLNAIERLSNTHNKASLQSLIGNKAYNLLLLHRQGINVPPFFVATTELFQMYEKRKEYSIENDLSALIEYYRLNYFAEKWIVRSSGLVEDSKISFAGVFPSYPNCESLDSIVESLELIFSAMSKKIVTSILDRYRIPHELRKIACIIQKQIAPEYSGVIFTADPIYGDSEKVVIEATPGPFFLSDYGKETYIMHKKEAGKSRRAASFLKKSDLENLRKIAVRIEDIMGIPQDIEYCIKDDIYILQTRPITTFTDEMHCEKIIPLRLKSVNKEIASSCGWKISTILRIELTPSSDMDKIIEQVQDYFRGIRSEYVIFCDCNARKCNVVHRDRAIELLLESSGYHKTVELDEFLVAKCSGLSRLNSHGDIEVEYIKGDILGLNRGLIQPSRCIIKQNGEIERTNTIQDKMFDPLKNRMVSIETQEITLHSEILRRISFLTSQFTQLYGPCVVKWSCDDDFDLYFFDADPLKPHDTFSLSDKVLSLGHGRGLTRRIDLGSNEELVQASIDKKLDDLDFRIDDTNEVIIVTETPFLSLVWFVLKNNVRGFIFKEASYLCHLSILLREMGVPALASEKLYQEIKDGDYAEIHFDKVMIKKF